MTDISQFYFKLISFKLFAQKNYFVRSTVRLVQGFRNILVLTDFTPASWEALKYGAMFHDSVDAQLTLLHVVPGKVNGKRRDERAVAILEQKVNLLQNEMSQNGGTNTIVLNGNVAQEIIKHVGQESYDLIVMGVNGNGGLNSDLGKNTKAILQSAGIPVMVLPSSSHSVESNRTVGSADLDFLS